MHATHTNIQRLFRIKTELQEVYWNMVIETFVKSLIGVFIPIYLISLHFSLQETITFALIHFLVASLGSPLSAKLSSRVGYKHQLLYRIPFFVVFYVLLITMQFVSFSVEGLYAVGLVSGFSSILYWVPLNTEFAKSTKSLHAGEEIGEAMALTKLASLAAPTLAAVILTVMGFPVLFAIAILLLLLSVAPLFASRDYKSRFTFRKEQLLFKKFFTKHRALSLRMGMRGPLFFVEGFMWPLFVFVALESVIDVGIAASLSAIGIAFFTVVAGKISDRGKKTSVRRLGGIAYALIWISRLFVASPLEIFLLSFLGGMFNSILEITNFSSFCDRARGRRVLNWVVYRELWLGIGRIATIILILLAVGAEFHTAFAIAALVSLLFIL